MGSEAQQREQLSKEITALTAEVKAAYEEYDIAADETAAAKAAWEAAEGIADAKEGAKLKGRHDALKKKEERRKERYEELKEVQKLRLQAQLSGGGERSPLPACSIVAVLEPTDFARGKRKARCHDAVGNE